MKRFRHARKHGHLPSRFHEETQKNSGRYNTASDYIRDLIHHDQERASKIAAMQKLVDEAFESGVSDRTLKDIWEEAKERAQKKRGD